MIVSARDLDVRRGARRALAGVTLTLSPGDRALVLGPAGSGKSTLLKALAGLLPVSGGAVLWDGVELDQLSRAERRTRQGRLAMVFQTDALFDSMSLLENVLLPLTRRRVPLEEAHPRAAAALEAVGLSEAAKVMPERASGGMRKRAGIARALVSRPEVLLADDPFAGLDPATGERIAALLLEVSAGKTLVVAVPEAPDYLTLDRLVRVDSGRLQEGAGQ